MQKSNSGNYCVYWCHYCVYWCHYCVYWCHYDHVVTISTLVRDNTRCNFSTSLYFENIPNYGSTETPVAMSSSSNINFQYDSRTIK